MKVCSIKNEQGTGHRAKYYLKGYLFLPILIVPFQMYILYGGDSNTILKANAVTANIRYWVNSIKRGRFASITALFHSTCYNEFNQFILVHNPFCVSSNQLLKHLLVKGSNTYLPQCPTMYMYILKKFSWFQFICKKISTSRLTWLKTETWLV